MHVWIDCYQLLGVLTGKARRATVSIFSVDSLTQFILQLLDLCSLQEREGSS